MKAHAILLAAGAGRRFGGRKLLTAWRGEPLVRAAARIALTAPVERVIVVTGADDLSAALEPIRDERLATVHNPEWQTGIASSLRVGIKALPADADCALVFLADMPLVPPDLAARLVEAIASGAPAALAEHRGAPAHPVGFARGLFPRLCALEGDRGARAVVDALPGAARIDANDPGSVFDVDHLSDLARQG